MTNNSTTNRHEIEISLYENVTIKQIKEIMSYGHAPQIDIDLDDEIFITVDFDNLDDFLKFFKKFGKYIHTVWDNSETGPFFHHYV